jgi:hypothetical protein
MGSEKGVRIAFCGTVLRLDFTCATAISVHPKMYPPLPLTRQAAV